MKQKHKYILLLLVLMFSSGCTKDIQTEEIKNFEANNVSSTREQGEINESTDLGGGVEDAQDSVQRPF